MDEWDKLNEEKSNESCIKRFKKLIRKVGPDVCKNSRFALIDN